MSSTIPHARGGFRFTRGTSFFAGGIVAEPGYAIVRARLPTAAPLAAAFDGIRQYLARLGRPMQALCGLELRTPRPYATREAFETFNARYVAQLGALDLIVDGLVPLTRANLAIDDDAIQEQCVYAFMYTAPSVDSGPMFATSAYAEVARLGGGRIQVVAEGDCSPEGLTAKVRFVVREVSGELRRLDVSWADVTHINAYAAHAIGPQITEVILPAAGAAARHGVTWHVVRPPVAGLDVELDVRALRAEILLGPGWGQTPSQPDSRG